MVDNTNKTDTSGNGAADVAAAATAASEQNTTQGSASGAETSSSSSDADAGEGDSVANAKVLSENVENPDPKSTPADETNAGASADAGDGSMQAGSAASNVTPPTQTVVSPVAAPALPTGDVVAASAPVAVEVAPAEVQESYFSHLVAVGERMSIELKLDVLADLDLAIMALAKRAAEINGNISGEINEIKQAHNLV